ncbi:hypothetical protein CKO44_06720 [Rubrivivax gelatinosus]|nr:hypothetical protein [Rubrivivax gelatinosus]
MRSLPPQGGLARTWTVRWTGHAWRGAGPLARRGLQGRPPADRQSRIRGGKLGGPTCFVASRWLALPGD